MLFKFIPVTWLNRRLMKIITAYNDCPTMQMLKLNIRYEPFLMPSFFFDSYTELEFEGMRFMAIRDYDAYLTMRYGDYMQLPPPDQRKGVMEATEFKFVDISHEDILAEYAGKSIVQ